MITEIQFAFLEARTLLPPPSHTTNDVMVIAAGNQPGYWSSHYIFTPGKTHYFIFIREPLRNCWVCADKFLQDWLDISNILALRQLEEVYER